MDMARAAALAVPACPAAVPGAAKSRVRAPAGAAGSSGAWGGLMQVQGLALSAAAAVGRVGSVTKSPAVVAQASEGVDAALVDVGEAKEAQGSGRGGRFWFDLLEYEAQHGPVSLDPKDEEQPGSGSEVSTEDVKAGLVLEEPAFVEEETAPSEQKLLDASDIVNVAAGNEIAEVEPAAEDHEGLSAPTSVLEDGVLLEVDTSASLSEDSIADDEIDTQPTPAEATPSEPATLESVASSVSAEEVEKKQEEVLAEIEVSSAIAELDAATEAEEQDELVAEKEWSSSSTELEVALEALAGEDQFIAEPDNEVVAEPEATPSDPPGDITSTLSPAFEETDDRLGEFSEPVGGEDIGSIAAALAGEDGLSLGAEEQPEPAALVQDLAEIELSSAIGELDAATEAEEQDEHVAETDWSSGSTDLEAGSTELEVALEALAGEDQFIAGPDDGVVAEPEATPSDPRADITSTLSPAIEETDDRQGGFSEPVAGEDIGSIAAALAGEDGLSLGAEEQPEPAALIQDLAEIEVPSANAELDAGTEAEEQDEIVADTEWSSGSTELEVALEALAGEDRFIAGPDDGVVAEPEATPSDPRGDITSSLSPAFEETDDRTGDFSEPVAGEDIGSIVAALAGEDGLSLGAEEQPEPSALIQDLPEIELSSAIGELDAATEAEEQDELVAVTDWSSGSTELKAGSSELAVALEALAGEDQFIAGPDDGVVADPEATPSDPPGDIKSTLTPAIEETDDRQGEFSETVAGEGIGSIAAALAGEDGLSLGAEEQPEPAALIQDLAGIEVSSAIAELDAATEAEEQDELVAETDWSSGSTELEVALEALAGEDRFIAGPDDGVVAEPEATPSDPRGDITSSLSPAFEETDDRTGDFSEPVAGEDIGSIVAALAGEDGLSLGAEEQPEPSALIQDLPEIELSSAIGELDAATEAEEQDELVAETDWSSGSTEHEAGSSELAVALQPLAGEDQFIAGPDDGVVADPEATPSDPRADITSTLSPSIEETDDRQGEFSEPVAGEGIGSIAAALAGEDGLSLGAEEQPEPAALIQDLAEIEVSSAIADLDAGTEAEEQDELVAETEWSSGSTELEVALEALAGEDRFIAGPDDGVVAEPEATPSDPRGDITSSLSPAFEETDDRTGDFSEPVAGEDIGSIVAALAGEDGLSLGAEEQPEPAALIQDLPEIELSSAIGELDAATEVEEQDELVAETDWSSGSIELAVALQPLAGEDQFIAGPDDGVVAEPEATPSDPRGDITSTLTPAIEETDDRQGEFSEQVAGQGIGSIAAALAGEDGLSLGAEEQPEPAALIQDLAEIEVSSAIAELDAATEAEEQDELVAETEWSSGSTELEVALEVLAGGDQFIAGPDDAVVDEPEATPSDPPGDITSSLSPAIEEADDRLGEFSEPVAGEDSGSIAAALAGEDGLSLGAEEQHEPAALIQDLAEIEVSSAIAELDAATEAEEQDELVAETEWSSGSKELEVALEVLAGEDQFIAGPDDGVVAEPEATPSDPRGDITSTLSPAIEETEDRLGEFSEPVAGEDIGSIAPALAGDDGLSLGAEEQQEPAALIQDLAEIEESSAIGELDAATEAEEQDELVAETDWSSGSTELEVALEASAGEDQFIAGPDDGVVAEPEATPSDPRGDITSTLSPAFEETDDTLGEFSEPVAGEDIGGIAAPLAGEDGLSLGAEEQQEPAALIQDLAEIEVSSAIEELDAATEAEEQDELVAETDWSSGSTELEVALEALAGEDQFIAGPDDGVVAEPEATPSDPRGDITSTLSPAIEDTDDRLGEFSEPVAGEDIGSIAAALAGEDGLSLGAEEQQEPAALIQDLSAGLSADGKVAAVGDDNVAVVPALAEVETAIEASWESPAAIVSAEAPADDKTEARQEEPSAEVVITSSPGVEDGGIREAEEGELAIEPPALALGSEAVDDLPVANADAERGTPVADIATIPQAQEKPEPEAPPEKLSLSGAGALEASVAVPEGEAFSKVPLPVPSLDVAEEETSTAEAVASELDSFSEPAAFDVTGSETTSVLGLEELSPEGPNAEQEVEALEAVSVNHVLKEITSDVEELAVLQIEEKQDEATLVIAPAVSDVSPPEADSVPTKEAPPVLGSNEEAAFELPLVPEPAKRGDGASEPSSSQIAPAATDPSMLPVVTEVQQDAELEPGKSQETINPCKVYVAGIPFDLTGQELRDALTELFGRYGTVKELQIAPFRTKNGKEVKGRHRGIAFVEMESVEEAKAAIENLHAKPNLGRTLMVREAVINPPKMPRTEAQTGPPGYQLYVGNLDKAVTREELLAVFKEYGTVVQTKVITDYNTGESRGFGFVSFATEEEARQAATVMNGSQLAGSVIKVNMS